MTRGSTQHSGNTEQAEGQREQPGLQKTDSSSMELEGMCHKESRDQVENLPPEKQHECLPCLSPDERV